MSCGCVPKSRRLDVPLESIDDPEEYFIAFFKNSIADPDAPKHCAQCLLGCAAGIALGLNDTKFEFGSLPPKHFSRLHGFCSAAVLFLTKERTSQQMTYLLHRLATCSCKLAEKNMAHFHWYGEHVHRDHNPFYSGTSNPTLTLAMLLFERLSGVLAKSSISKVSKGHNHQRWPSNVADIIVHRPDTLVQSIKNWTVILPLPLALSFLSRAVCLSGRILVAAILKSPDFLRCLFVTVGPICKRIRRHETDAAPEHPLSYISLFLGNFYVECPSKGLIVKWAEENNLQHNVLRALLEMLDVLDNPTLSPPHKFRCSIPNTKQILVNFGILVKNTMAEVPPELKPDLWVQDLPQLDIRNLVVMNAISFLTTDNACSVAGCRKTFQELGDKFKRCSACRVVSYCSVECQGKDWKTAKYPHRKICQYLQGYVEAGMVDLSSQAKRHAVDWIECAHKVEKSTFFENNEVMFTLALWARDQEKGRLM